MKRVMVVGGGKIGVAIAEFLGATGDYRVTVADKDAASLDMTMANKNMLMDTGNQIYCLVQQ